MAADLVEDEVVEPPADTPVLALVSVDDVIDELLHPASSSMAHPATPIRTTRLSDMIQN
jgi:hypothetical protein